MYSRTRTRTACRVCKVDVGEAEPAGIVCGAPNVAAGQTVAVALPGARMPDGTKIKAAKLRGVPSHGMILAADELQIDNDHTGIMALNELALPVEPAPGMALADVLAISTDVLELEITPNRPDCLGCTASHASCTRRRARRSPRSPGRSIRVPTPTLPRTRPWRSRSSAPTCAGASPRGPSRRSRSPHRRLG